MRRTETGQRQYVEVYHRSGLRVLEFCAEHGLNPKTFYTWRRRYARLNVLTGAGLGEPRFVPLQIRDDEVPGNMLAKPPRLFSFKTPKFCLEIALESQHNQADNGAELRLIVQTLQELL